MTAGAAAALWRRILALPESRLMMLGTPNQGSYETLRWLTGNSPTLAKLSLLDLTQGREGIIDIVRGFPGLLELLPCAAEDPDFSRPEFWQDLKQGLKAAWNTAEAQALRQARETWAQLRQAQPDPRSMVYVAGCQPATVAGYRLEPYEESYLAGRRRLSFLATAEGDGTVTWSSGVLPQVPVWYARDTAHDALCSNRALFPGYLDLLTTGQTSRLPQTPPARSRDAAGETFPLPDTPPLDAIPDAAALALAGFGPGAPMDDQGPAAPVIRVNIRHGNLAYARHPVLVGHYLDDTIVNAERALDERLGGALSRRQQLGLYPGRPGSHALFFHDRPEGKPAGAMVIGLGQVGQLSPSQIEAGVRDGLLAYALHIAQWPDGRFGPPGKLRSAALSCLLVGSGAGGGTVADSVEAILRGALAAAGRLAEAGLDDRVVVDRIEFLELYQDIAISAAEALERVLADSTLAAQVQWPSRVIDAGEGGLRRLGCQTASDWWQRLEILEEAQGSALRFIASTDRARAEVTLATGQLRLADGFISSGHGQRGGQHRGLQDPVRDAAAHPAAGVRPAPGRPGGPGGRDLGALPLGTPGGPLEQQRAPTGGGLGHGASAQDRDLQAHAGPCLGAQGPGGGQPRPRRLGRLRRSPRGPGRGGPGGPGPARGRLPGARLHRREGRRHPQWPAPRRLAHPAPGRSRRA